MRSVCGASAAMDQVGKRALRDEMGEISASPGWMGSMTGVLAGKKRECSVDGKKRCNCDCRDALVKSCRGLATVSTSRVRAKWKIR